MLEAPNWFPLPKEKKDLPEGGRGCCLVGSQDGNGPKQIV